MVLRGSSSAPLGGLRKWSKGGILLLLGMLLAVSGQRLEILLTSCNAQNSPPTLENHLPPMSIAPCCTRCVGCVSSFI